MKMEFVTPRIEERDSQLHNSLNTGKNMILSIISVGSKVQMVNNIISWSKAKFMTFNFNQQ